MPVIDGDLTMLGCSAPPYWWFTDVVCWPILPVMVMIWLWGRDPHKDLLNLYDRLEGKIWKRSNNTSWHPHKCKPTKEDGGHYPFVDNIPHLLMSVWRCAVTSTKGICVLYPSVLSPITMTIAGFKRLYPTHGIKSLIPDKPDFNKLPSQLTWLTFPSQLCCEFEMITVVRELWKFLHIN